MQDGGNGVVTAGKRDGGPPRVVWRPPCLGDDAVGFAHVAQLVEHTLGKGEVIGSIPIASL